jgi:CheY-like chemotaxis protein
MDNYGDLNSFHVLHVEDNPDDVRFTEAALLNCTTPFHVTIAVSGEDALDILLLAADGLSMKPDLILLDLGLPRLSGVELLQFIKEHDRLNPIPVIVLSGLAYAESLLAEHGALVHGCFSKPKDIDGYEALAKDIERVCASLNAPLLCE